MYDSEYVCRGIEDALMFDGQLTYIENAGLQIFWFPVARMFVEFLRNIQVTLPEENVPLLFRPQTKIPATFKNVEIYLGKLPETKTYPCLEINCKEEKALGNAGKSTQDIAYWFDLYTKSTDFDSTKAFEKHYFLQLKLISALYAFQKWFSCQDLKPYQLGLDLKVTSVVFDIEKMEIPVLFSRITVDCGIKKVMPPRQTVYKKY